MDYSLYSVLSVLITMPPRKELSADLKDAIVRHFEEGNSYVYQCLRYVWNPTLYSPGGGRTLEGPRDECKCPPEGTTTKVTRPCGRKGQNHGKDQPHCDTGGHQGGLGSGGHLCLKVHSDKSTEQDWGGCASSTEGAAQV